MIVAGKILVAMYLEDEHIMSDLDGVRKRGTMLQTLVYDIYTGFQ